MKAFIFAALALCSTATAHAIETHGRGPQWADCSIGEKTTEGDVPSLTEGRITADFVPEKEMMADLLAMLAKFGLYMKNDFHDCQAPNSMGEACGFFNGESSGHANEAGVRTNADLSMLCAFLLKYAKPAGTALPTGVSWERIEEMAMKSLVFAYSTHKANRLKVCAGNTPYWGSTSEGDHVWESSLWAMSVAYSAYFQWNRLTAGQKGYIYNMLKAECNYELERAIPTGCNGDTKAEENGWEADVLAATLGLFPDDALAPRWFDRLRAFAINSYSHPTDAHDTTVTDPGYDSKTVSDLFIGNNLYDDYTLQNHNLFHTSYQNVVMQELGEAALALKLFQGGSGRWSTNALMHNNRQVMDNVLNWLALTDGELAMPNGNDWSLFLYDQITSYSTQACFQRDPNALMLENLAYKYIKARQQTTADGSWLLRPDVGARRMGVEGHRVMMTYLMHLANSTADLTPTAWEDFRAAHSEARLLPCQNVVRAFTKDRFTCFSWSGGLKSYTGYFAANSVDKNKIVVPYRANNTGNITGWYTVSGKATNATPVVKGIYDLKGDGYVMNGELNTNDNTLNNRFAIYSTPGNAIIYLDEVKAIAAGTIASEHGGMLAVSTDEMTKLARTLYYNKDGATAHRLLDGNTLATFESDWVNIDNALGVVGHNGKKMAFGDRTANNSIYTAKLYPMYAAGSRQFLPGDIVDRRNLVYYSNIDAATTARMCSQLATVGSTSHENASGHTATPQHNNTPDIHLSAATGWNAAIAADPDDTRHLLLSNFRGDNPECTLEVSLPEGAPVFSVPTATTADGRASATFSIQQNHSVGDVLKVCLKGVATTAVQTSPDSIRVTAAKKGTLQVWFAGTTRKVRMKAGETRILTNSE
ncbi:MAG: hypothetical protein HUK08_07015 [Bacteroidaceae bacterium]|nr:hypothetical protein [Bacteroidaceae bacterium]